MQSLPSLLLDERFPLDMRKEIYSRLSNIVDRVALGRVCHQLHREVPSRPGAIGVRARMQLALAFAKHAACRRLFTIAMRDGPAWFSELSFYSYDADKKELTLRQFHWFVVTLRLTHDKSPIYKSNAIVTSRYKGVGRERDHYAPQHAHSVRSYPSLLWRLNVLWIVTYFRNESAEWSWFEASRAFLDVNWSCLPESFVESSDSDSEYI